MSSAKCCVPGCKNTRQSSNHVLHCFPNPRKDLERFKSWIIAISGDIVGLDNDFIYKYRRVCHCHFDKKFVFYNNRLSPQAVPTLELLGYQRSRKQPLQDMSNLSISMTRRSSTQSLKIALVQLAVGPDKQKNVANAVQEIYKAKERGAHLVALPECFNSPYGTKYFDKYAEEVPTGETSQALSRAAIEAGVCVIGGTFPERSGKNLYNTCTVWDVDGKLLAKHRKIHLFDIDIPGKLTFRESETLSAGDEITTFDFQGVKIGLGICYDVRFKEIAQIMADKGCSLLVYPGAFNMTTGPLHWELLGRARATDEQLWVALVSPARDPDADYIAWGHTTLINPWGTVVEKLDEKPATLTADIDLNTIAEVRSQIPIRKQRRTDLYETISKV